MTRQDLIHLELPAVPVPASEFMTPRARSVSYPGTRPSWSFCFVGTQILPMQVREGQIEVLQGRGRRRELDIFLRESQVKALSDRYAVLAVGSNACPARLADSDKYGAETTVAIPVLRGWVEDVVSVYCPRRASYGSVPATIAGMPGARSRLWATLLTAEELQRMDESEERGERYQLIELPHLRLNLGGGLSIGPLSAYFESRGLARLGSNQAIRLACFRATGTPLHRMSQLDVQAYVGGLTPHEVGPDGQLPSTPLDLPIGSEIVPLGDLPTRLAQLFETGKE